MQNRFRAISMFCAYLQRTGLILRMLAKHVITIPECYMCCKGLLKKNTIVGFLTYGS